MIITVIGGGKMGLPLACRLTTRADAVIVCDINQDVVDKINTGVCTIEEPGLATLLTDAVTHGRLRATVSTTKAVSASDVVVVIVPALLDSQNRVDLSALESVATQIGEGLVQEFWFPLRRQFRWALRVTGCVRCWKARVSALVLISIWHSLRNE